MYSDSSLCICLKRGFSEIENYLDFRSLLSAQLDIVLKQFVVLSYMFFVQCCIIMCR